VPKLKDYYDVLGIPHRAHVRVIEESYWEQAHELKKTPTRKAVKRLQALNEAYEILSTPHKRMTYDGQLAEADTAATAPRRGGVLQLFVGLLSRAFRPD
jgi:curved DNA-binding protein CbpA